MRANILPWLIGFGCVIVCQMMIGWLSVLRNSKIADLDNARAAQSDILLFGDSVIRWPIDRDVDRRTVIELLRELETTYTIADLSDPSNHLGLYEAMLRYVVRHDPLPKAIIVPINMETFSPGTDIRPEYQFERDTFLLTTNTTFARYLYKPLAIFGAVEANTVSYATYRTTPVYDRGTAIGTVGMFDDPLFMERAGADGVRLRFLYQYGYTLDRNHRKVRSLEHLLTFAQDADIHVYVYVSPLNWEGAKNVVGEDFVEHIAQNVDVVCSVVREHSLPCLDLSRALDSSHFETPVYPGSHLDISGRLFLARALHEVFIRADQRFIQHSPTP